MTNYTLMDSDELLALARIDFQKENYGSCLEKLKCVQSRNPIPIGVYSLLGRTYAVLELFDRARDMLTVFLKHVPNALQEKFHLGMVEKDLGNLDNALEHWSEVIEREPSFIPALYHKAAVCMEKNAYQEASQLINKVLELAPDNDQFAIMARDLSERIKLQ